MLTDKLKEYSKSGVYPFHMPGHKRMIQDDIIPYNIDLTEIDGFDNLHGASGCIKGVADLAAEIYSVNFAYLLVNGATGGILSAIRALTKFGDKVLIARNCHKSVYNAAELCGLDVEYILPEINSEFGIFSSVSPAQVERMLIEISDIKLVVITSPTYEGVVSDIKVIAEICHRHNAMLFVDEAHGAHFPFSEKFPDEAVSLDADATVVSLHKTLPSLTQTALLLTNNIEYTNKIEENLAVFESSSPSYILMSSIEKCLQFLKNSDSQFNRYIEILSDFINRCCSLKHLKLLTKQSDFFDFDIGKLVISTADTSITGVRLAKILREEYHIETEMAYTNYILAMTSVCDTSQGFDRLYSALLDIDSRLTFCGKKRCQYQHFYLPEKAFTFSKKDNYSGKYVHLASAENCICLEYIWAYPPGIPIIAAGEILSLNVLSYINNLRLSGVNVFSSSSKAPDYIYVAEID